MGHAFHTPAPPPQRRPQWRRERRRAWSRPSNLPGTGSLFAAIPVLPRDELARLTERMIDRMDQIDGDPDVEDLRDDDEDTHDREDDRDGDQ
ncbi:hypothetical protein [uncultured Sphingomonas sp.]|uniref:hypothetical protein n=1 Tax=uncultured Sphingomonas sp. TaxID=158754 RepID=UPI0025D2D737|nr:hypothetical protein [uncultured Sphingomonas sp.]